MNNRKEMAEWAGVKVVEDSDAFAIKITKHSFACTHSGYRKRFESRKEAEAYIARQRRKRPLGIWSIIPWVAAKPTYNP